MRLIVASLLLSIGIGTTASELAGTRWQLVSFQSMDDATGNLAPAEPSLYTMTLLTNNTVSMQLNCNRASGTWEITPTTASRGQFKFGPLATTRALCPPPSMDEKIARDASYVRSYVIEGEKLYLSLMADGGIYEWERRSLFLSPSDGGPRNWQVRDAPSGLRMRQGPSTSTSIVAALANASILDNLGCREMTDRTWCEVQRLGGGPVGYVAADYLTPAISPDGSIAMGRDDSALRAGKGDFDATGSVPCATEAGQPTTRCEFGVSRAGGGYATVVIVRSDGYERALYFRMGMFIGANTSQADGYPDSYSREEADLYFISVGSERYEIPAAVIFGG